MNYELQNNIFHQIDTIFDLTAEQLSIGITIVGLVPSRVALFSRYQVSES